MTTPIAPLAGIDIAKDHLDAAFHPSGEARHFTNDRAGHTALPGVPFAKLNPRHARRFAEATGRLTKTDRTDARVLARFGALLQPESRPPRSELLDQPAELAAARRALIMDRTATTSRAQTLTLDLLKRQAALRLKHIAHQLAAIDAQARALVAADPTLARRLAILTSIPGLGETTAMALIADMPDPRIKSGDGTMDAEQAASLAGRAGPTWSGSRTAPRSCPRRASPPGRPGPSRI